jgi:phage terminase large subunit-like protein
MGEDDTSEVGLQEVRENYKKVIPLIDSDGWVLMPGTRKHYNDLYQGLMDTETYRIYVRHGLEHPEKMCDTDECSRFALPHKAPHMKVGLPVEPRRMNREDYSKKLAECQIDPKQGQSYFWHEYMNIPFSPTDRKYQPRWFNRVDDSMIPGGREPFYPLQKYISIDSAWKEEEHPSGYDYTAIGVAGFDDLARLYILDIFRDKNWTIKQGCHVIVQAMKAYGISHVIYQKVSEMTWTGDLLDACRRANIPLIYIPLTRGGRGADSKTQHMLRPQNSFESGRVFFRKSCENFEDAVNEFCNIGRWTNDDIADMISNLFDDRVRALAPRPKQPEDNIKPFLRPMPFDGTARRAAFASTQTVKPSPYNFGRNGQVQVDGEGNPMFTPDQVEIFATRSDKQQSVPQTAFRMFR